MNKLFESRPFLIEFIRRCDQATLRMLLKPICKQLVHPDVMREIARNLELSGMETIRFYQGELKWKYSEFLKFDEKEANILLRIIKQNNIDIFDGELIKMDIVDSVRHERYHDCILYLTKYTMKTTRLASESLYGLTTSLKTASGKELIDDNIISYFRNYKYVWQEKTKIIELFGQNILQPTPISMHTGVMYVLKKDYGVKIEPHDIIVKTSYRLFFKDFDGVYKPYIVRY